MADQKTDLAALRAKVEAAEADAETALSDDDAAFTDLTQRLEAANEKIKSKTEQHAMARMTQRLDEARVAANGAYVVGLLNADDKTDGAGKFIVRSPTSQGWKSFMEIAVRAKGDAEKSDRAHRNFSTSVILHPKPGADLTMEELTERYDKYPGLAASIADFSGDLGAVAAGARKR